MDILEKRTVPLTVLVTPSEAEHLKNLMWRSRQPLSGWLRTVALDAARRLARQSEAVRDGAG